MSYILKNTSALLNVRLTDAGRKKLSTGNLTFSLFQIGDSEMCYDCYTDVLIKDAGIFVTEPSFNAQNLSDSAIELNKQNVKYPLPVLQANSGATYGLLSPAHQEQGVYNRARSRGFFSGNTTNGFSAFTNSPYVHSANWCFPVTAMTGSSTMILYSGTSNCGSQDYYPQNGDLIMVQYGSPFQNNYTQGCDGDSLLNIQECTPVPYLWYKVISGVTSASTSEGISITVDRNVADWSKVVTVGSPYASAISASTICAHVLIYPKGDMLNFYGSETPTPYWSPGSLSFDNNCDVSVKDVDVWNMNVNWTQWDGSTTQWGTVAGVDGSTYETADGYGSSGYCGTKEYLGYNSDEGQFDTTNASDYYGANYVSGYEQQNSGTYIRDSFNRIRTILPDDQRTVAILHYTNQTISNFYGEKFALEPNGTQVGGVGEMDEFKICMPTIMWHKKKGTGTGVGDECNIGQCFYVDPPGFDVAQVQYIQSNPNQDMNTPGIRYYHLWDDNLATATATLTEPNRVGKVFPDLQMIIIDDQELVTAMSYKSNRNWTLPMPKLELIPAGTNCEGGADPLGLFNAAVNTEQLWFTYMFESSSGYTSGMHCNYYNTIIGDTSAGGRDVAITFGDEFPFLRPVTSTQCCSNYGSGWQADNLKFIMQKTAIGDAPDPASWKIADITAQIPNHTVGAAIEASDLVGSSCSFYLNNAIYTGSTSGYTLHNYINVPLNNNQEPDNLQFGDEYFFYGNMETDIMATIYEMRYHVTLGASQFNTSTNPTWSPGTTVRFSEIGLYDSDKDLLAIAKLQSPQKRQGAQQLVIKVDF